MQRGPQTPGQALFVVVATTLLIGYSAWENDRDLRSSPHYVEPHYPEASRVRAAPPPVRHDYDASKVAHPAPPLRDDIAQLPGWLPLLAAGAVGVGGLVFAGVGYTLLRRRDEHDELPDDFALDDPSDLANYDDDQLRDLLARHDARR